MGIANLIIIIISTVIMLIKSLNKIVINSSFLKWYSARVSLKFTNQIVIVFIHLQISDTQFFNCWFYNYNLNHKTYRILFVDFYSVFLSCYEKQNETQTHYFYHNCFQQNIERSLLDLIFRTCITCCGCVRMANSCISPWLDMVTTLIVLYWFSSWAV